MIRKPIYNREQDGPDVFKWILEASQVYRNLKQHERQEAIKQRGMSLDNTVKPENKTWKTGRLKKLG